MKKKLKVAVYAICKNEAHFVKRFMESAKEADVIYVSDTGSSDDTVAELKKHGAIVNVINVRPWRFDVARNISLSFLPNDIDICVCFDLDEVFTPGWRDELEKVWEAGKTTRCKYVYVWSHDEHGNDGVKFLYEKIHARHGFRWVHPVHEVLSYYNGENVPDSYANADIRLDHWPDPSKSRGQYLPLLELSTIENPNDDRNSHYLGREYMFYGLWEKSIAELKRHLSLKTATWDQERCASMRFIARCYRELGDFENSLSWAYRAIAESKHDREPYMELIRTLYAMQKYDDVIFYVNKMVSITDRQLTYICDPECYNESAYDYLAMAHYMKHDLKSSIDALQKGLLINPDHKRMKSNLEVIMQQFTTTS